MGEFHTGFIIDLVPRRGNLLQLELWSAAGCSKHETATPASCFLRTASRLLARSFGEMSSPVRAEGRTRAHTQQRSAATPGVKSSPPEISCPACRLIISTTAEGIIWRASDRREPPLTAPTPRHGYRFRMAPHPMQPTSLNEVGASHVKEKCTDLSRKPRRVLV